VFVDIFNSLYFNGRAQLDGRGGGSGGRFDVAGMGGNGDRIGENSGGMKLAHTS